MNSFLNTNIPSCMRHRVQGAIFLLFLSSCSLEEVKKGGYEAMQENQTQQCLNNPHHLPADCLNQQSYETYEQQRQSTP